MMNPVNYLANCKEVEQHIYSFLEDTKGARYDNRATSYEWLVGTRLFNQFFWHTTPDDYKAFAREAIVNSQGNMIDICCGGLAQTAQLYKETRNDCTLVDRSVEMLKVARSRLMDSNGNFPPNIRLIQANAFQLPFPDNSFDTLCSFGAIHLFDNKQDFVNELLRVLKPGGKFYFTSMTTQKIISRVFMYALSKFNEFGELFSPQQYRSLFDSKTLKAESYMIGSVIFIHGQKIK